MKKIRLAKSLGSMFLAGVLTVSCLGCGNTAQNQETTPEAVPAESIGEETETADTAKSEETTAAGEEDQTPVEITIGGWADKDTSPEEYEAMETVKAAFQEKYPWITVKEDTWGYSVDTFLPKAAANQLPDLFDVYPTEISKIVNAGYAADLTEMMDKYGYTDALQDNVRDMVTVDGKIYFVPEYMYTLGLVANSAIFEEAGELNEDGTIPWPDTWEELGELAGRIKEKTGKIGFQMPTMNNNGGWLFTNIAWSYGAEFVKQEDGKWVAAFNSEECAQALQLVSDLKWKYNALSDNLFVDSNEYYSTYGSEQVAMMIGDMSYSNMEWYIDQYQMDGTHMALGKMPGGPAGRFALTGGAVYMIPSSVDPAKYDALFKWLDFNGAGPEMTEEAEANYESTLQRQAEKGVPILDQLWFNIWKSGDTYDKETALHQKYATANMKNFESYLDFSDVNIHAEPEVCAQELYSILDNCIQQVLQDQNADIPSILEKAANDYQINYLDNEN